MSEGVLLDLTLSTGLQQRVMAQNNKAALFGTLENLAKIEGCVAVYWGLQTGIRTRLLLVAAFDGPTRRSKIPLDRLLPFLAAPPRIFDIVFLSPLSTFDRDSEVTVRLARSRTTHSYRPELQIPGQFPSDRDMLINSDSDEEDWVDFQAANKWSVHIGFTSLESKPSIEWLETRKRILHGKKEPHLPVPQAQPEGHIIFQMIPHKYQIPSATSYYHYRNGMKSPAKGCSLADTFNRLGAEDMANEDGWVLVT